MKLLEAWLSRKKKVFRMKGIPHIPYKAILTQYNVDYTFARLYQSVANEYQQMMQMNLKK